MSDKAKNDIIFKGLMCMINIWIDEMTPCLKDAVTGEYIPTEVIRIVRKSFLNKFNRSNGWYDYEWTDAKI